MATEPLEDWYVPEHRKRRRRHQLLSSSTIIIIIPWPSTCSSPLPWQLVPRLGSDAAAGLGLDLVFQN